jgi:trehalose-phosphatase
MKYLFSQISKIKKLLRNKSILLLLDYDGTLTPIAKTPSKEIIKREIKVLLQKLSGSLYCKVGIISGRKLKDIKSLIGESNIIYAGNHGLEIQGLKGKLKSLALPHIKLVLRKIVLGLQKRLLGIKGVFIEDKGLTLSVHYRLVKEKDLPVLKKVIVEETNIYLAAKKNKN